MFQSSTLQIFLTIYHGSLIGTFFYDYIVRNAVRLFEYGLDWKYVTNIGMGILFLLVIVWAIASAWRKVKMNLLISLIALIIIFIVRLGVGIPDMMDKQKTWPKSQFREELSIFIAQETLHLTGIVANWMLYTKA
jgi:hypothetical protein